MVKDPDLTLSALGIEETYDKLISGIDKLVAGEQNVVEKIVKYQWTTFF